MTTWPGSWSPRQRLVTRKREARPTFTVASRRADLEVTSPQQLRPHGKGRSAASLTSRAGTLDPETVTVTGRMTLAYISYTIVTAPFISDSSSGARAADVSVTTRMTSGLYLSPNSVRDPEAGARPPYSPPVRATRNVPSASAAPISRKDGLARRAHVHGRRADPETDRHGRG